MNLDLPGHLLVSHGTLNIQDAQEVILVADFHLLVLGRDQPMPTYLPLGPSCCSGSRGGPEAYSAVRKKWRNGNRAPTRHQLQEACIHVIKGSLDHRTQLQQYSEESALSHLCPPAQLVRDPLLCLRPVRSIPQSSDPRVHCNPQGYLRAFAMIC